MFWVYIYINWEEKESRNQPVMQVDFLVYFHYFCDIFIDIQIDIGYINKVAF